MAAMDGLVCVRSLQAWDEEQSPRMAEKIPGGTGGGLADISFRDGRVAELTPTARGASSWPDLDEPRSSRMSTTAHVRVGCTVSLRVEG
jgi:hypothetical protein